MRDILGRDIQNEDIIAFPFLKREGYRGAKASVYMAVGIVKGERVYTIDGDKYTYKSLKNAEGMALKVNESELTDGLKEKISQVRIKMSEKKTKK